MATNGSFTPKKLFRELNKEILKALILKEYLNAALLFFILNIPLALLSMSYWYSIGAVSLYLIIRIIQALRRDNIALIEQGNPEVHELLHTALQYKNTESIMVQGLMRELQKKLATVSTGVLINPKRAIIKILLIGVCALIPLAIFSVTPQLVQANPLAGLTLPEIRTTGEEFITETINETTLRTQNILFGDENVAELGDEELDVTLRRGGDTIDVNEETTMRERNFQNAQTIGEITAENEGFDTNARVYSDEEIQLINDFACKTQNNCE